MGTARRPIAVSLMSMIAIGVAGCTGDSQAVSSSSSAAAGSDSGSGPGAGSTAGKTAPTSSTSAPTSPALSSSSSPTQSTTTSTTSITPSSTSSSTTPKPPVTAATLQTAEVPADCRLPAQRLVNNATTEGSPGGGSLTGVVAYGDLAGLGYNQALTAYGCSAGGVSWPQDLVLIGSGGKLLAHLNLGDLRPTDEHTDLGTVSISGGRAHITFTSYQGAAFDVVDQSATVTYQAGKLVIGNHRMTFTAQGVVDDIFDAVSSKKRSHLVDRNVLSDAQWQQFTQQYAGYGFTSDNYGQDCPTSGSVSTCTFQGLKDTGTDSATWPKASGSIQFVPDPSNGYGWKVSSLQFNP